MFTFRAFANSMVCPSGTLSCSHVHDESIALSSRQIDTEAPVTNYARAEAWPTQLPNVGQRWVVQPDVTDFPLELPFKIVDSTEYLLDSLLGHKPGHRYAHQRHPEKERQEREFELYLSTQQLHLRFLQVNASALHLVSSTSTQATVFRQMEYRHHTSDRSQN